MNAICLLLALVSMWDYPARHQSHDHLRRQFVVAVREGDTRTMEETCRKGVALLPDDPTWHYNLACSLAYFPKRTGEALDELEKAIDLGFRDKDTIAADTDLKRLSGERRFEELLEYAEFMKSRPMFSGPLAAVDATGIFGTSIALGEQNLGWDFDLGCFVAKMRLAEGSAAGGNVGDLYMNRDGRHSMLNLGNYPGLTSVTLDAEGRARKMDMSYPNILFPYPVFGNASLGWIKSNNNPYWRSLSRALLTNESGQLGKMAKFYLSNQIWVFPSVSDTAPVGTDGDVFASIAPYWITTAGRSGSDQHYLCAALEASRAFKPKVKAEIVKRGLLSPTIQTLIRKSLKGVTNEVAYLSARAHPTAMPPGGVDYWRLAELARAMTVESIPPLAAVSVTMQATEAKSPWPELTYASVFAWAFVLRADDEVCEFWITARGAEEFAFVQTHGEGVEVKIERMGTDAAKVVIRRRGLSPTNRVDIAVFGRNAKTGWGAPSYVSFARMDPAAPYSDPALTVLPQPPSGQAPSQQTTSKQTTPKQPPPKK